MLIVLYSIGMYVLVLGVLLASIVSKKARKLVKGIPHTFKILKAEIKPDDRVVWFHAASLG